MVKEVKHCLWVVFIGFPLLLYRFLTRKAYYISGTFINAEGKRMWFKTVFLTHGSILPISSLQKEAADFFGADKTVIVNISRIPYRMAKYVEKDMSINIIIA